MDTEFLERYRKIYIKKTPSMKIDEGWNDLRIRLAKVRQEEKEEKKTPFLPSSLVLAGIAGIILITGILFSYPPPKHFQAPISIKTGSKVLGQSTSSAYTQLPNSNLSKLREATSSPLKNLAVKISSSPPVSTNDGEFKTFNNQRTQNPSPFKEVFKKVISEIKQFDNGLGEKSSNSQSHGK